MSLPAAPYPSRDAFALALGEFINQELPRLHPKAKSHPSVSADTLLFATGLIDSMAILHLIAFIERATGSGIPPEKVVMKHFQSITAIANTFWTPPPAP